MSRSGSGRAWRAGSGRDQRPSIHQRLRTGRNVRRTVAEYESDAVVSKVESMETLIDGSLMNRRNNVVLLGLFSGITLLLVAVRLYAAMAYVVARRTQEIGLESCPSFRACWQ